MTDPYFFIIIFLLLRNKSKYKIQYITGMLHVTDITYIETCLNK